MPTAHNGDIALRYAVHGDGPTIVCCPAAGLGAWQWSYLTTPLAREYEIVTWDYRGTGRSDAPGGPYTVADLVADLEAVLADHGARSVHLVGAGLGGVVAIEYARRAGRVATLTLLGTPISGADVDAAALERLRAPRDDADALRASLQAGLSSGTVESYPEEIDRIVGWRREDDAAQEGWDGQTAAMLGADLVDLYEVTTPALVFQGVEDAIVDPGTGERLANELPRGEYRAVESGHLVHVEEPQAVADELLSWLDSQRA
jgi:pimeloyl-ACP methyl ester carboxylesterase